MILLASKSPRRRELLKLITDDFKTVSADVDEALPEGISPADAVLYLSRIKAEPFRKTGGLVIGADTVVTADGIILGKPKDADDAYKMLSLLSGKTHEVFTGVTLIKGEKSHSFFVSTRVKMYELSQSEIRDYISTNEPFDKAGAYGIQGRGALLIEKIDGDYFNVVGLPVSRLSREMKKFRLNFA